MLRRVIRRYRDAFQAFGADTRGTIIIVWAFAVIVVIVAAGGAIDYARAVNVRTQVANALDAAVLAGARQLSTSAVSEATVKKTVADYYRATLVNAGFETLKVPDPQVSVDPTKGLLTATTDVPVPTSFVQLVGIREIPVGTVAQVTYSRYNVELSLVLDVTGSMKAHMATLRSAAKSVVDILIPEGTKQDESKVRIAVVPYSQGVNLGEFAKKVSDHSSSANCVTERLGPEQYTDAAIDYAGTNSEYFGGGSNSCQPTPQMEPLTSKRNKLTSAISKLSDGGRTAGQTGIGFGWYALSPKWADLWPKDSEPGSYTDNKLLKFTVLMTDGDFNTYYEKEVTQSNCKWKFVPYPPWFIQECKTNVNWYEREESESYTNVSSTRARNICAGINKTNITVFAIYFGTNNNSAGAKVMQDCATNVSQNYFQASNSDELVAAFQTIASKIQAIYLSK